MQKKGFVLLETIVVITVLGVILIMLYQSYYNVINTSGKKTSYDNTEYIYKTEVIREYLENIPEIKNTIRDNYLTVYCSDTLEEYSKCSNEDLIGYQLFNFLKVKAVYFSVWNVDITNPLVLNLEPTTQSYIKYLNAEDLGNAHRIIVMYEKENEETELGYEYASLRIIDRE